LIIAKAEKSKLVGVDFDRCGELLYSWIRFVLCVAFDEASIDLDDCREGNMLSLRGV
jgi:hypothetical protein